MNRKLKKFIAGMVLVLMTLTAGSCGQLTAWAADAAIAFSDPSVMAGNDVTVTMKITGSAALGNAEVMLAYDSNILEFISGTGAGGGAGAVKVQGTADSANQKSFSFNLKFKTLQAGNAAITVTSQEIYDADSKLLNLSKKGTSTVKVTSPAGASKDAALKSLKISPGTLTPEFSASVDTYEAQVGADTTNLVVNAVAANAGAHVSLEGEKGLKAGVNPVVVKVTAEDGQTVKNYTIQVTKAEGGKTSSSEGAGENGTTAAAVSAEFGDVTAAIDGTEYSVALSFDETALPEGFEAESYQYKGTEVMAGKGLEKDLLLLYLKDAGGNGGFFIYNEDTDSWSRFVQVETSSKAIVVIPLDGDARVPEGFAERQAEIDGVKVTGWVPDSEADSQYCLFYAMNWNGEKYFYSYDLTEKTIQRYFPSGVSGAKYQEVADTYNELVRNYHIQFYVLIAVSLLTLGLLIALIMVMKKGGGQDFRKPGKNGRKQDGLPGDEGQDRAEESAGNVKRYSRQEYDKEVLELNDSVPEDSSSEGDFIEETSLEDLEQEIASKNKKPSSNDKDDFEFIDLDD